MKYGPDWSYCNENGGAGNLDTVVSISDIEDGYDVTVKCMDFIGVQESYCCEVKVNMTWSLFNDCDEHIIKSLFCVEMVFYFFVSIGYLTIQYKKHLAVHEI